MKYKVILLISFIAVLFSSCDAKKKKPVTSEERTKMQKEIETREDFISENSISFPDTTENWLSNIDIKDERFISKVRNSVTNFYKKNNYSSRWLYEKKPSKLFYSYLDVLEDSKSYGFNPQSYGFNDLKKKVDELYDKKPSLSEISEMDKQITSSFMLFANHLKNGRILDPSDNTVWRTYKDDDNEVKLLLKVTDTEDLVRTIEILHPNNQFYEKLRNKLVELDNTSKENYHQFNIDLKAYELGYENENIELLRENLEKRGYAFEHDSIRNRVDEELFEKIKEFQEDKKIKVDGLPGETTLYYLNLTNEELRKLLVLNMERLRWLNKDFGKEYLTVNIPQYMLYATNDGKIDLEMKVIVGGEYNPTPIFIDSLEYIEFRPTWTVPQSIIRKEMIPNMASDPTRYTRQGFTISENGKTINPQNVNWSSESVYSRHFTIVQQPSNSNALGLVKFIFPNNLSIYLHDTPSDHLFERDDRALSHGCIRVSDPIKLATYLLRNNDNWDSDKVKAAMTSGKNQNRVYLKDKLLVQLLYLTAFIKDDDVIVSNDVYGLDKEQLDMLNKYYGI